MAKDTDQEPEKARVLKLEQSTRLTRLRTRLGLTMTKAAEMGMIDDNAWGRMERGEAKINPVALNRFIAAVRRDFDTVITSDYIITGRNAVMDDDLLRELHEVERLEQRGDTAGNPGSLDRKPRGRPRRKNSAYTPT